MANPQNRREQLRRQQEAAAKQKRTMRMVGIAAAVVAFVLLCVFGWVIYNEMTKKPAEVQQLTPQIATADGNALKVAGDKADAPLVTLYFDYQCPVCAQFESLFGDALEQGAKNGDWQLQTKTMTFMDRNLSNTASTRAALAATCSANTGHYPEYSRAVFANQAVKEVRGSEGYSDKLLRETLPGQVGITGQALTDFQACYDGKATQTFVDNMNKSAYADGVTGTPSLRVNGKDVDLSKVTDAASLRAAILAAA